MSDEYRVFKAGTGKILFTFLMTPRHRDILDITFFMMRCPCECGIKCDSEKIKIFNNFNTFTINFKIDRKNARRNLLLKIIHFVLETLSESLFTQSQSSPFFSSALTLSLMASIPCTKNNDRELKRVLSSSKWRKFRQFEEEYAVWSPGAHLQ